MPEATNLTVRSAVPGDAAVIADFNSRLAEESEGKTLDAGTLAVGVAAALADPNKGRYWLACDGDQIVGQLMVTNEWSDWRNGWIWWIQSVYVSPGHRRRGVFASLFAFVEKTARIANDVVGIRLYVEHANDKAMTTYHKVGMNDAGYRVYELMFR